MNLTDLNIDSLQPSERLKLISALWDSFADGQPEQTSSQTAELDRRLDSFEDDKAFAKPWDQIKAELNSERA